MTAGLLLGLTRHGAARFSFLLSIPVMVMAGGLEFVHTLQSPAPVSWSGLGTGLVVSALVGYACIHVFLGLLEKIGMLPFVIYRWVLAAVIVYVFV